MLCAGMWWWSIRDFSPPTERVDIRRLLVLLLLLAPRARTAPRTPRAAPPAASLSFRQFCGGMYASSRLWPVAAVDYRRPMSFKNGRRADVRAAAALTMLRCDFLPSAASPR